MLHLFALGSTPAAPVTNAVVGGWTSLLLPFSPLGGGAAASSVAPRTFRSVRAFVRTPVAVRAIVRTLPHAGPMAATVVPTIPGLTITGGFHALLLPFSPLGGTIGAAAGSTAGTATVAGSWAALTLPHTPMGGTVVAGDPVPTRTLLSVHAIVRVRMTLSAHVRTETHYLV